MAGTNTSKNLHRKVIRRNKVQSCRWVWVMERKGGGVYCMSRLDGSIQHRRPPGGTTCSKSSMGYYAHNKFVPEQT